jgi:ATP-dependent DNA ligase
MSFEHIDRPKYLEVAVTDHYVDYYHLKQQGYDTVELKMDGIWGCMHISDGKYTIYSRTGKVKQEGDIIHSNEYILLGEFMKGSHWGHKMGFDGHFFAFDCLKNRKELHKLQLKTRRKHMQKVLTDLVVMNGNHGWIRPLMNYPITEAYYLWRDQVMRKGYEGLVAKKSNSFYGDVDAWARIKKTTEIDYMCIGFEPADKDSKYAGQVGAVTGSLVDKPCKVQCSGLSDKQRLLFTADPDTYLGRVFTATGHGWFPSGSVRHPKFSKWRDDKGMLECTYDQLPECEREDVGSIYTKHEDK